MPAMEYLKTTTYDGETFITHRRGHFPTEKAWVAAHRRKVLWHLYVTGTNRLPKQDLLSDR